MPPEQDISILAAVFLIIFAVFTRPLTVIAHEFGHAIPALLFSKGDVTVYIGSYGDPEKSTYFKHKRLNVYFKFNSLDLQIGLCTFYPEDVSYWKRMLITLGGPFASLIVASVCVVSFFVFDPGTVMRFLLLVMAASCILDFLMNIIPSSSPIKLFNGEECWNDGKSLVNQIRVRRYQKKAFGAFAFFDEGKYAEAADAFKLTLEKKKPNPEYYKKLIQCYFQLREYEQAEKYMEEYANKFTLQSEDLNLLGVIKIQLGKYGAAMAIFSKELQHHGGSSELYNNLGHVKLLAGEYDSAIRDLNKAIEINPEYAAAYNHRGFAKAKRGLREEGIKEINRSIQLDANNALAFRNLGILHFERDEFRFALTQFEKAAKVDPHIPMLQDYLEKCREIVERMG